MKSIKKVIFCFIFLIGLFGFQEQAYAAYTNWPGFSAEQISTLKSKYPNYDFCVYNAGDVLSSNAGFNKTSKQYSNKSFIFAYDVANSNLKFVNYNLELKSASGSYIWDDGGFDQLIRFETDFKSYLVENNTLSCKKLIFIGTAGTGLGFSKGGSLDIHTLESFTSGYYVQDYQLELVEQTSVEGTLYESEVRKCDEYLSKLQVIANRYYNDQKEPLEKLKELKNADFKPGDFVIAQGYIESLQTLLEQTIDDLDALELTDVSTGDGFYVGICQGTNSLKTEYSKLKTAILTGKDLLNNWKAIFDDKLKEADPTGDDDAYDQDRNASKEVQKGLDALNVKWENYLKKINTGQAITDVTCEGLLGSELLDDISMVLTWIRIAVPILLILLGSVDFAKAVLSDDQQELKKCTSRFVKRCVIAIAIFFIPSIIMYLLSFIDKIADVSCDIRLW